MFKLRRKKLIIFLLCVFTLLAFAYVRRGIFFYQAKKLIEQNLGRNLACRLSIGKITPQLFYGLVLEDLEIDFPKKIFGLALNIKVEQAMLDSHWWEIFFSGYKREVQRLRLISPAVNLSYSETSLPPPATTQVQAANLAPLVSPDNQGTPVSPDKDKKFTLGNFMLVLEDGRISFGETPALLKDLRGRLLLSQSSLYFQDIQVSFNDNPRQVLHTYGELTKEQLTLTANLEHLQIKNFDILTNLTLSLDKGIDLQDKTLKFSGTLKTYGSVLNNRPFPELNSSFEIRDSQLRILTCSLGDNYNLRGIIDLNSPFHADLSLNFYQAALNELLLQLTQPAYSGEITSPEEFDFSGLLNGLIKISGPLGRPDIEGYLEAEHGHIGDLDFVSADINIKGHYPKIFIVNSRICREEDYFIMEGKMDFANLEKQDFLDLKFKANKAVFWQGWDITRGRDNQVHMSKNIADDFKITFDTFVDDETRTYDDDYANELGLEYEILGDKVLKLRLRKEEEILGVERRVKF